MGCNYSSSSSIGENRFEDNDKQYDIDKILNLAYFKSVKKIKVQNLTWILLRYDFTIKDEMQCVKKADYNIPIIIYKDIEKRDVVVEGIHRLYKALQLKKKWIQVKIITIEELKSCEI